LDLGDARVAEVPVPGMRAVVESVGKNKTTPEKVATSDPLKVGLFAKEVIDVKVASFLNGWGKLFRWISTIVTATPKIMLTAISGCFVQIAMR